MEILGFSWSFPTDNFTSNEAYLNAMPILYSRFSSTTFNGSFVYWERNSCCVRGRELFEVFCLFYKLIQLWKSYWVFMHVGLHWGLRCTVQHNKPVMLCWVRVFCELFVYPKVLEIFVRTACNIIFKLRRKKKTSLILAISVPIFISVHVVSLYLNIFLQCIYFSVKPIRVHISCKLLYYFKRLHSYLPCNLVAKSYTIAYVNVSYGSLFTKTLYDIQQHKSTIFVYSVLEPNWKS